MFSGLILFFPFPFSSFVPFHASIFDLSLSFLYLLLSTFPVFSVSRPVDRESTGHQTWKRRVTAWKICRVKGERSMSSRRVGGKFFKFLSRGSRGDPSNAIGKRFETKLDGSRGENKSGSLRCSGSGQTDSSSGKL